MTDFRSSLPISFWINVLTRRRAIEHFVAASVFMQNPKKDLARRFGLRNPTSLYKSWFNLSKDFWNRSISALLSAFASEPILSHK